MRFTAASPLLLSLLASAACMAPVGGGGADRDKDGDDDDREVTGDCEQMNEDVTIRDQADLDALPTDCWDLYGTLTLQGSQITSLVKLGKLEAVNDLVLDGTNLATLDSPQVLRAYGKVTVIGNTKLTSLKNLEVERPDGLVIDNNAVLASLDAVGTVTDIGGPLLINSNPKLAAVAMPNLAHVTESIRITNNAALANVDLARIETVKGIELTNNVALTTFGGMYATQIDGDFTVRGNRALTSLGSMASLGTISGSLTIDDNDALTAVGGFTTSLKYVTAFVTVTNNANLTDLGQVSRMSGIGAITITSNPKLSFCRAQEVDHCVTQHGAVNIQFNLDEQNCDCWCH